MASEFFWDTSGFFALLNSDDPQHERARQLTAHALAQQRRSITTEWIIGECCTLLTARRRVHLIPSLDAYVVPNRSKSRLLSNIAIPKDGGARSSPAKTRWFGFRASNSSLLSQTRTNAWISRLQTASKVTVASWLADYSSPSKFRAFKPPLHLSPVRK